MAKINLFEWKNAFGYYNIDAFHEKFSKIIFKSSNGKEKTRQFLEMGIAAHDALNAASIVASPLVGIIRAITALVIIKYFKNIKEEDVSVGFDSFNFYTFRSYLWMQVGRGAMEFFCLGPILGLFVDTTIYCNQNKLLCFKG